MVLSLPQFEPRDLRSSVPIKNRILEETPITGHLSVEIHPLFNFHSKCSFINEVPELGRGDTRSVLRVWWACLVDSYLLLYKKYGDSIPFRTLVIIKVSWYTKNAIRVASLRSDETIVFTCPEKDMRSDWYHKLRGAAKDDVRG